jgi:hypothetical protein
MPAVLAFEYKIRTRQKTDEVYTIHVDQAPGHWIAEIHLPDGSPWTMSRFDPKAPNLPKQWVGATAAAAADYAARILANYFANEGMEIISRRHLLEQQP